MQLRLAKYYVQRYALAQMSDYPCRIDLALDCIHIVSDSSAAIARDSVETITLLEYLID